MLFTRSTRSALLAVPFVVVPLGGLASAALSACTDDPNERPNLATPDAGRDGTTDAPTGHPAAAADAGALAKINHVVVLYLENHSFDNLYGSYPGAEGIPTGGIAQVGPDGKPYDTLPQYGPYPAAVGSLQGATIPNAPFDLTTYFPQNSFTNDLLHRFYQEQKQINGGKMDSFVLYNDQSAGQSMGYWPTNALPVPKWLQAHASNATVCDHFFHAAFGGSFLNHFWLIGAQSPKYANAPANPGLVAQLDGNGQLAATADTMSTPPGAVYNTNANDGTVTPDGYAINTAYSVNQPHPPKYDVPGAKTYQLIPQQTYATIADELDAVGASWAWYAGGWNAALQTAGASSVGTATPSVIPDSGAPASIGAYGFMYHHQPFVYFANWGGTANNGGMGKNAPNGKWATNHNLQDEQDFIAAAGAGKLPAVSWVKPLFDEHPNYATVTDSEDHAVDLINAVVNGPNWKDTVLIITYDENGGQWDHVAPPTTDKWGPGTRVPAVVISPFAKGGIDSTVYDTTAILKFIEKRWSLAALSTRDAAQNDLSANALKLTP